MYRSPSFALENFITEFERCQSAATNNEDVFVAFITDRRMANTLLQTLCDSQVVNRQFGIIEVRWSNSEEDIIQHVGKGLADLALVKENVMQAFATQRTHGYKELAHYKDYTTYLISMKEKPQLNKQYLWGKRIGLLDYPSSRSGHIVPKSLLNELGLTEDNLDIVYSNSHEALRDLLAAGEVDLISSYWQQEDSERFSANYITPIESNVSGSKWYLKLETQNTDLACDVQHALQRLTKTTASRYYSQLTFKPLACDLAAGSNNS